MNEKSWAAHVGRREFVRSMANAVALAAFPSLQREPLRLGILQREAATGFDEGISLGLTEAARAAALFHRKPIATVKADDAADLVRRGAAVIAGFVDSADATKAARECNARGVVYLNCAARSDGFREQCGNFVFHIEASESMYSDAAKRAPGSRITLWDSSLAKYGAAQLNDRFRAEFKRPMNANAWAGWIAAKIVWESLLRMKGEGSAALRQYLLSDQAQFDGHKGAPLSFRPWDHQLRQPLYVMQPGKPPQDVPDIARSGGSIREALDSIGRRSITCRAAR